MELDGRSNSYQKEISRFLKINMATLPIHTHDNEGRKVIRTSDGSKEQVQSGANSVAE